MLNHEEIFQQVRFEEAIYEAFRGKLPPKKKLEEEEDEPEHDPSERLADDAKKEAFRGGNSFRSSDLLPDPKNPPRKKITNFLRKTVGMKPLEESMASAVDEFVLVRDMHKHKMPKPVEVFVDAPPRPIRDPHPPSPENHFGTVAGVTLSLAVATFMALGFAKQAIEKAWAEAKRYWDRDPTLSEVRGKLTPMGRTRTSPYAEGVVGDYWADKKSSPVTGRFVGSVGLPGRVLLDAMEEARSMGLHEREVEKYAEKAVLHFYRVVKEVHGGDYKKAYNELYPGDRPHDTPGGWGSPETPGLKKPVPGSTHPIVPGSSHLLTSVAIGLALTGSVLAALKLWHSFHPKATKKEIEAKAREFKSKKSESCQTYSSQLFLIESDEVMEPILARRILAEFKNLTERRNKELKDVPDSKFLLLTPREEEMMLMIAEGKPNKMIANHMGIAENTVRNHIANIFAKLQVNNRTEAAIQAYKATRDPIEGLEPRSGPVLPFPKEFKASSLESPTKQDLVTLTNISLALDQLQRQLSTFGRVQHTSKIYEDTITAVYSALLMWRDQELNTAAQLTTSHKFPQAKRIVDKVIETAKKNSEKKHNQPLDVLIQKNIEKKQEYRQKDFANRRTQRVLNKMRTK